MRSLLISSLTLTISLLTSAIAHARCTTVQADGLNVSFINRQGIEIKDAEGQTTLIDIEDAPRSECVSLKVSPAREHGTSLIEAIYQTGENGTKTLIDEKNFVLVSVKDKKLVIEPITLAKTHARQNKRQIFEMNTVAWKKKNGSFVLEQTDVDTKEVSQVWPATAPAPSPEPLATPDLSPPRPPPAGTDSI